MSGPAFPVVRAAHKSPYFLFLLVQLVPEGTRPSRLRQPSCLALYVASFGPACWGVACGILPIGPAALIYDPIPRVSASERVEFGHESDQNWLYRYGWRCSESDVISEVRGPNRFLNPLDVSKVNMDNTDAHSKGDAVPWNQWWGMAAFMTAIFAGLEFMVYMSLAPLERGEPQGGAVWAPIAIIYELAGYAAALSVVPSMWACMAGIIAWKTWERIQLGDRAAKR